jgi:hypothetical protein
VAAHFPYLATRTGTLSAIKYFVSAQRSIISEIIMIKYLAVAAVAKLISRFNFAYRVSCLSITYPVGKLYLTDDTRLTLILKL